MLSELSDEQRRVLDPGTRVVEAGPGSGKTRALVQRYIESTGSGSGGVVMLSFTNAAIDEVRRRTRSTPKILQAPHFVGTIDSFLHRFIVTPTEVARLRRLPTYLQSWDDLPSKIKEVRLSGVRGAGISLSAFRLTESGDVAIGEPRRDELMYIQQVADTGKRENLLNYARAKIRGLMDGGTFDSGTARVRAYEILRSDAGSELLARLTRRFSQLLVDEAQDCDAAEMAIIRMLAEKISVIVVADPDQSIYEFRGSKPNLFLEYRDEQPPAARCALTTNFRSTPAICRAVSALRAAGASPINADDSGSCSPVLVLRGTPNVQREMFLAALEDCSIAESEAVVLAHGLKDAQKIAGGEDPEGTSRAIGNRLLAATTVLACASSPTTRLAAIRKIELMILSLLEWDDEHLGAGRSRQLEVLDQREDWLRLSAARVVADLNGCASRDIFGRRARDSLQEVLRSLPTGCGSLSSKVRKPDQNVWIRCQGQETDDQSTLMGMTVHAAKGTEYPAVLVALPGSLRVVEGRSVLDDWESGSNTEPRRVLYVAASRAQKLLAFGAGKHADRIASLLETAAVPIEVR